MERRLLPELMDDPALDAAAHHAALRGLRRINAVSGSAGVLWRAIERIAARRGLRSVSVLDVACGGGDLLGRLARRAGRSDLDVRLAGCDISPRAIDHARQSVAPADVELFVADAVGGAIEKRYDFVTTTLFLHHLDDGDSIRLLRSLRDTAVHAVLVDDLVRGRVGYGLAWAGCRLLTRSPIVHYDGPASVAGAYTVAEARRLGENAGLTSARFTRHWLCRFLMEWERPS